MYVGKHEQRRKKRRSNRSLVLTISVIALVVCIVGASLAYLFADTDGITNTFTPTKVTTGIDEDIKGGVKEEVVIENTGDIEAYIRAKVVVTWKDSSGNVYGKAPVLSTDYTVTYNNTDWFQQEGIWYYKQPVASKGKTENLLTNMMKVEGATVPEGYDLSVEIISEAIQSQPRTTVTSAWGVAVDTDGTLKAS